MPNQAHRGVFVGRQRELLMLLDRLEDAASGKGGVVLIGGEPGVGKTRLVQELAGVASAQGRQVLSGRAYDLDMMSPYLPFSEALVDYVSTVAEQQLREQLGRGAADVALLVPELRARLPGIAPQPSGNLGEDRHRLFDNVATFLLNIARATPGGLLLILDDLHWADQPTLQLAVHLSRRLAGAPLLLVATYRTVELERGALLLEALAALSREGQAEHILLGPLSVAETAAMMEASLGAPAPPAAVDALFLKTEGNPFFAREVLWHLQTEARDLDSLAVEIAELQVPEGVRQVIGKRLARLSPAANRVLEACAVLGDGVGYDLLAAVCDGEDEVILDALDEVIAAGMVREESESYHLSHTLVRQTIDARLLMPRKQRLHRRAAEAIERLHTENLDPYLGSLALHYERAGGWGETDKALDYAERAATAAGAVFAHEEAARHLDTGLRLIDGRTGDRWLERRARLLRELGMLLFGSGLDWARAVSCLEEAAQLYEQLGQVDEAALTHVRLGHARSGQLATMNIPRALEHLRLAEITLGSKPASAAQGDLYHALAVAALTGVRTEEGLAASARALEIADRVPSESLRARACLVNGSHTIASGRIAKGLIRLEQGWDAARRARQVYALHLYGCTPSDFLRVLGAPREAEVWSRRSLAELERSHAAPDLLGNVISRLGQALLVAGEAIEPRRLLKRVSLEGDAFQTSLLGAHIALVDGDWARADSLAGQARDVSHQGGHRQGEWYALSILAQSQLDRGQRQRAAELLEDALAISVDGGRVPFELANRASLAMLAAQGGESDEAQMHLLRCREILAGGEDWRGLAGRVALAEATLLATDGRPEDAESYFDRAIETFRRHDLPWDEAEALRHWGAALESAGERTSAAKKLAAARIVYECIGADPTWAESIAAPAQRLPSDRRAEARHANGLTAREMDVLRLLAAGESNREIAARFVLSTRTVERHVASIYGKIGARRRADATAYALRHGLDQIPTP